MFIGAVARDTFLEVKEAGDPVDFIIDLTIPYVYHTFGADCNIDESDYLNNPDNQLQVYVAIPLPEKESQDGQCHAVDALVRHGRDPGLDGCVVSASRRQIIVTVSANMSKETLEF